MGSVQRRGDTWRARWRTPEGDSRSKAFRRKVDAEAFLATTEHRKISGEYVDRTAGKVTLRDYAEAWRAVQVVKIISVDQVMMLAEGLPERYRALVTLGAGTGLRQGEAFGLTADRVEFLKRTLTVDRQMVLTTGQGPTFGPPKTDASNRTIPLPDVVLVTLTEHMRAFPPGEDGLLFTNDDGNPIRRTRFSDLWRPVARAAGLEPGVGFHALRHFYASALIRHGESVKVVQSRLGHASAAETLDTYSHLWPDSEDRTRAAVQLALGSSGVHSVSSGVTA